MTEYMCSCHIKNKSYSLETCAAVTISQAVAQFRGYVEANGGEWEMAEGVVFDRIEL